MKASIVSVNVSEEKGTIKQPVAEIVIDANGVIGDAHAGAWHRQLSLLSSESIARFAEPSGRTFQPGEFAENLTTAGLDLGLVRIPDQLVVGEAKLEVSQIGKACHGGGCAIFREVGKCVMPKEGIFCRVLKPGTIRPGDALLHEPRTLPVFAITLSDRASSGVYQDKSGGLLRQRIEAQFKDSHWRIGVESRLIPDEADRLRSLIKDAQQNGCRILFTTGGTGLGPRDITPDVIRPLLDRELPGIMEFIRVHFGTTLPNALLSRGVAGVIGNMLVYTLPGSVKAVNEYLDVILPTLDHSLRMMDGLDGH